MEKAKITNYVLDFGDEETQRVGLLVNPEDNSTVAYRYQWVLVPKAGNGNYTEIQAFVSCLLTKPDCLLSPTPELTE
jgi:hypothetical protein